MESDQGTCLICDMSCDLSEAIECIRCNVKRSHLTCVGIDELPSESRGVLLWCCASCEPIFKTQLSLLDRMSALEQKVSEIDSLTQVIKGLRTDVDNAIQQKPLLPMFSTVVGRSRNNSVTSISSLRGQK